MLNVNQLIGFGAGGGDAPARGAYYIGEAASLSSLTSHSIPDVAIGTPAPNRIVCVAINGAYQASSVTIGGVSATQAPSGYALWYAVVPSGTTATISVTFGTATAMRVGVFNVHGAASTTPIFTEGATKALGTVATVAPTGVVAGDLTIGAVWSTGDHGLGGTAGLPTDWASPATSGMYMRAGCGPNAVNNGTVSTNPVVASSVKYAMETVWR